MLLALHGVGPKALTQLKGTCFALRCAFGGWMLAAVLQVLRPCGGQGMVTHASAMSALCGRHHPCTQLHNALLRALPRG